MKHCNFLTALCYEHRKECKSLIAWCTFNQRSEIQMGVVKSGMVMAASACLVASASAVDLTTPMSPSLWVASNHDTQAAVGPPVGSSAVAQPSWAVLQWYLAQGNQPTLPPAYTFKYLPNQGGWNNYINSIFQGSNNKWTLSNATSLVEYNAVDQPWLNGTYTLLTNGIDAHEFPCGGEFDLWLSPKGPLNDMGPLASGAPNGFIPVPNTISSLNSLVLDVGINIKDERVIPRCTNPAINQIAYAVTFFLKNVSNGKNFFYSLTFRDSRITQMPTNGYYGGFADAGGNVGAGDYITNLASSVVPPAPGVGRVAYNNLNILPRIKQIISSGWVYDGAGPNKIYFDGNVANWRVDGVFIGQAVWGGALGESQWDNFKVQAF
jgi:hypothetical protein